MKEKMYVNKIEKEYFGGRTRTEADYIIFFYSVEPRWQKNNLTASFWFHAVLLYPEFPLFVINLSQCNYRVFGQGDHYL